MKRMVTQGRWELWNTDKNLYVPTAIKMMLRSVEPFAVYISAKKDFKTEMLIGYCEGGEIEVNCDRKNQYVRLQAGAQTWFRTFEAVHPIERADDTTYASLDRPSRLSPEMEAVMRMVRKNEIEREHQREQNARIQEDIRRIAAADRKAESLSPSEVRAEKTAKVSREKQSRSKADAEKSEVVESGVPVSKLDEPSD